MSRNGISKADLKIQHSLHQKSIHYQGLVEILGAAAPEVALVIEELRAGWDPIWTGLPGPDAAGACRYEEEPLLARYDE